MAWSCHYATGCFVAFLGDISTLKSGWNMKKIFCCPALELFHCLPLWKTVLFVSSRAFSLSTPTFLLSTPVDNSEATWKKATKCNKLIFLYLCFELSHRPVKTCIAIHVLEIFLMRHTITTYAVTYLRVDDEMIQL